MGVGILFARTHPPPSPPCEGGVLIFTLGWFFDRPDNDHQRDDHAHQVSQDGGLESEVVVEQAADVGCGKADQLCLAFFLSFKSMSTCEASP